MWHLKVQRNYNQFFKDQVQICDISREPVAARCPTPRPRRKSEKNRRGRRRRRQRDSSAEKTTLQNGSTSMSCFTQNSPSVEPHDCKLDESCRRPGNHPPVPPRRQSCPPPPHHHPGAECRVFKRMFDPFSSKVLYFDFPGWSGILPVCKYP